MFIKITTIFIKFNYICLHLKKKFLKYFISCLKVLIIKKVKQNSIKKYLILFFNILNF